MAAAEEAVPTELVAGKYKLTRLLGRGGMGSVWEGVHTTLGTRVAVKYIDKEFADSAEARGRFENEARAAATLRSKHVVQIYDHGVSDDGRPYIVMEFLAGEPLDRRLDRLGQLDPQHTAFIVNQVCRALAKAHEAGIVHRDLKPENVFLVWDEEDGADIVKVVDFGIAKFTDKGLGMESATRTGSVLGTPHYMSPEQARGLRSVDYRADLWGVGVITYRCVVGALPFDGEAIGDLLVKICTQDPPVPSQRVAGLSPSFDAWFTRALNREPAGRFGNALEMADALSVACGLAPRNAPPSLVDNPPLYSATQVVRQSGAFTPGPEHSPSNLPTPSAQALSDGLRTTAPTANTPTPYTPPSRLPLLLGAVGIGMLVLGVGGAVVVKTVFAKSETPEPAPAAALTQTAAPEPSAEPAPSSSETPQVDTQPAVSAKPSQPAPTPTRTASKPVVKPVAKPVAKPVDKPLAKPITTAKKPTEPDPGY